VQPERWLTQLRADVAPLVDGPVAAMTWLCWPGSSQGSVYRRGPSRADRRRAGGLPRSVVLVATAGTVELFEHRATWRGNRLTPLGRWPRGAVSVRVEPGTLADAVHLAGPGWQAEMEAPAAAGREVQRPELDRLVAG
jgi:hypothetical protein